MAVTANPLEAPESVATVAEMVPCGSNTFDLQDNKGTMCNQIIASLQHAGFNLGLEILVQGCSKSVSSVFFSLFCF